AFSDALLVAEAPLKSGAMITMEMGYRQKKSLFALPGRAFSETYQGNHSLIKSGKAELVDHPNEIAERLGILTSKSRIGTPSRRQLSDNEKKVLDLLSRSELFLDELSFTTNLSISDLQATLIQLQLFNLVVELPGKQYKAKQYKK